MTYISDPLVIRHEHHHSTGHSGRYASVYWTKALGPISYTQVYVLQADVRQVPDEGNMGSNGKMSHFTGSDTLLVIRNRTVQGIEKGCRICHGGRNSQKWQGEYQEEPNGCIHSQTNQYHRGSYSGPQHGQIGSPKYRTYYSDPVCMFWSVYVNILLVIYCEPIPNYLYDHMTCMGSKLLYHKRYPFSSRKSCEVHIIIIYI